MDTKNQVIKQFKFEHASKSNEKAIIKGKTFRFTLLTDRLIRIEYSEKGEFEDRPSQTFWFRNQPVPEFTINDSEETLEVKTEYLHLIYQKEQPFCSKSLSIKLIKTNSEWNYGMKEKGNLKGTYRTLDRTNGPVNLEKGLLSTEGHVVVDDQPTYVFDENSWVTERIQGNEDLYFFGYGHDYKACIKDYYKVSGATPLLPRFALGNWWSKYWDYTDEEQKELILNFEQRNIPLAVCIIDMDWHVTDIPEKYGRGWTGYSWNRDNYPDPKAFLSWLKTKKLQSALNLHPALGIRAYEDCYEEVADFMDVDKKNEETVNFDCTDPKFMNAYFTKAHHPIEETGIDFWWMDWQQGNKSKMEGLDPLWMLNHLHFLDLGRDGKKRPFIFSRWPGLGGHRYPIGFSGDTYISWSSLAYQPYFNATAANVGYGWWSNDIGGFYKGCEEPELYARWVEFGVFSPIFRLHSTKNFYMKREPWRWDHHIEWIVSNYMRLRHQLIPYIYTMSKRNADYGMPLVTPMYYDHPENKNAYQFKEQYFYGTELMVAPFITPMIEKLNRSLKKVWIPDGIWFNFFDGEVYTGDKVYSIYGALDQIPVFAKSGAIIPLALLTKENQYDNPDGLEVHVFPGKDNQFTLYEDDGVTLDYEKGKFAETNFNLISTEDAMKLTIHAQDSDSIIPEKRSYVIKFRSVVEDLEIKCSTEYEHTYDKKAKTHIIKLIQPIKEVTTIELITECASIIDVQYDYIGKVMDLLDSAMYDTNTKLAIGYACPNYKKSQKGILNRISTPKQILEEILLLDIDNSLKEAILTILLKAI